VRRPETARGLFKLCALPSLHGASAGCVGTAAGLSVAVLAAIEDMQLGELAPGKTSVELQRGKARPREPGGAQRHVFIERLEPGAAQRRKRCAAVMAGVSRIVFWTSWSSQVTARAGRVGHLQAAGRFCAVRIAKSSGCGHGAAWVRAKPVVSVGVAYS
jgi:hypothetical protein